MDQKMTWADKRLGAPAWICKTVGGTTMRWSGVTPRFRDFEFKPRSTYGAMDDTNLIDWPLTLEEIEPYYDKAESKMGISGTHDMPPSFETSNYQVLKAGGQRNGYKEITSSRSAINSIARDGRPADRVLLVWLCDRRQVVDAVHGNPKSRNNGALRAARRGHGDKAQT